MKQKENRVKLESQAQILQLQHTIDQHSFDVEREVQLKLSERFNTEQTLNETIIKLQKDQQGYLSDLKELKDELNLATISKTELEDKQRRLEDELSTVKFR